MKKDGWSSWQPFPDPRSGGYLSAPFGTGVYHLRLKGGSIEYILYGHSKNVAHRMSSLLPGPLGTGTRRNDEKRQYVLVHIQNVEYRTLACNTVQEAKTVERDLQHNYYHKFDT